MNEPRERRGASGRTLVLSFAAVALMFTLSTAAEQVYASRIRSAAEEITGNSQPSISSLSAIRSDVRRLEVVLTDFVEACPGGGCVAPPAIDQLRGAIGAAWDAYRQLPTFPGESDGWPAVDATLRSLDDAVNLAAAAAATVGRAADAHALLDGRVKPSCDRSDLALARLSEFDRTQGAAVAARIDRLARASIRTSILLVTLSIVLTAFAAVLAIGVVGRYERSLRERSDELDRFAGRVAHDVMSPLASTALALRVARRHSAGQVLAALETGERGVRRVQRLVEDLLEFARSGAPASARASTDVREALDDVLDELRPVADQRGVALHVEASGAGAVACAPGVLSSVISNLLRNAIAYTGDRPVREVTIRTRAADDRRAVRVEVEDTGPGIPPELGDTVFEPFVRGADSDQPGTGLGLATAKRFVTAHGGQIGYRSSPGGTTFWFELPAPALRATAAPSGRP